MTVLESSVSTPSGRRSVPEFVRRLKDELSAERFHILADLSTTDGTLT